MKTGRSYLYIALIVVSFAGGNYMVSETYWQKDWSQDKIFTFGQETRALLEVLDDALTIEVFLTGDLPATFRPLEQSIQEICYRLNRTNRNVQYAFVNPSGAGNSGVQQELLDYGLAPVRLSIKEENVQKLIFPYARIRLGSKQIFVSLLESNNPGDSPEASISESSRLLEYKLAASIQRVYQPKKRSIGILRGHGGTEVENLADFIGDLQAYYDVVPITLDSADLIPDSIDLLILSNPIKPFAEMEKFVLDQYIMSGGKAIFLLKGSLIDESILLSSGQTVSTALELGLTDLLFKYGVRVQHDVILDASCTPIPLVVGQKGDDRQIELMPWYYHPLALSSEEHPIVHRMDPVNLGYASSLDTLSAPLTVSKYPLLVSGQLAASQRSPAMISLDMVSVPPEELGISDSRYIMAVLLEGTFPSLYRHRFSREMKQLSQLSGKGPLDMSAPTQIVVVGDGDLLRNELDRQTGRPEEVGYNKYENKKYANKQFILNAIEYMTNPIDLSRLRNRTKTTYLLDKEQVRSQRIWWQLLNIGFPVLIIGMVWIVYFFWRRRVYGTYLE